MSRRAFGRLAGAAGMTAAGLAVAGWPRLLTLDPRPPGGSGLVQVGGDGGLLGRPIQHDHIDMFPAERFDVVVDFARYRRGTKVQLVNLRGTGSTRRAMQFVVGRHGRDDNLEHEDMAMMANFVTT